MRYYVILFFIAFACGGLESKENIVSMKADQNKKDSTVFVKKDSKGRVIEKWGNEKAIDNDLNFRFFYEYDEAGRLIAEKHYFFDSDNTRCVIKNTEDYDEIKYTYDKVDKMKLIKEEKYIPVHDSQGNVLKRRLYYIKDHITGKFISV
jgi:hypothetical protein